MLSKHHFQGYRRDEAVYGSCDCKWDCEEVLCAASSSSSQKKADRPKKQDVTANKTSGRVCDLTGKRANNGYNVTFSHTRNKKMQQVNLHYKRVYWPEGKRYVKLRICSKVHPLTSVSS